MSKILIALVSISLLFACRKTSTSFDKSFPGFYKVVKINSATPVDLNNDGVSSVNVYAEITNPYKTPTGEQISFYDFQSQQNYMEVRPLPFQNNDAKLIAFNFPHQIVDYSNNITPFLVEYNNEFLLYTYKINPDNSIQVSSANPDYTNQIGVIKSLNVKENEVLVVQLAKQVFDFADRSWKQIDLTVEYSKMP